MDAVFFRCFERAIEITSAIRIIPGGTRCLFHLEEIAIQIEVREVYILLSKWSRFSSSVDKMRCLFVVIKFGFLLLRDWKIRMIISWISNKRLSGDISIFLPTTLFVWTWKESFCFFLSGWLTWVNKKKTTLRLYIAVSWACIKYICIVNLFHFLLCSNPYVSF